VNLITGDGEMSITSVSDLIERVRQAEKPGRILYVSDFDFAGNGMPVSVARKIEKETRGTDIDIRLDQIVLTRDQVDSMKLPRKPAVVKKAASKKGRMIAKTRIARFEESHGEGAVELDALEAWYPGRLAEIVEGAILEYRDTDLEEALSDLGDDMQTQAEEALESALAPFHEELEQIREEMQPVIDAISD